MTGRIILAAPAMVGCPFQARAILLDRLADQQLQAGYHHQAERLAHEAAELRTSAAGGRA